MKHHHFLFIIIFFFIFLFSFPAAGAETDDLTMNPIQKTVISQGSLHIVPAENSSILENLKSGDRVFLIAREEEWYIIKLPDNRVGWGHESIFHEEEVPEDDALESSSSSIETQEERKALFQAVVRVRSARVREMPSLDSDINFGLERGTLVSVMDKTDKWYLIQMEDGKSGWSYQKLFSTRLDNYISDFQKNSDSQKKIEEIRVEGTSGGDESVVFTLNGFYPPKTFALNEEVPKIVCDFFETHISGGIGPVINVAGKMVDKIRIGHHKGRHPKIRVVVDLDPYQKYGVEQVFFKKTNVYTLIFKPVIEEAP